MAGRQVRRSTARGRFEEEALRWFGGTALKLSGGYGCSSRWRPSRREWGRRGVLASS
jgi:hypothetical protein